MIEVSERAAARICEVVTERPELMGLRFGLTDGGCSGYTYMLEFEAKPDEDDMIFEQHGAKVFVHPLHLPFVQGSTIRFQDEEFTTGFAIDNPNVKRMCGCGESFDV